MTLRIYGWEDNFVPAGDIWQCVETFLVVATRGSTRYYWVGVKDTTDSPTWKNFQGKISTEPKVKTPHIWGILRKAWFLHLHYLFGLLSCVSINNHKSGTGLCCSTGTKRLFFSDFSTVEKTGHRDGWAFQHQELRNPFAGFTSRDGRTLSNGPLSLTSFCKCSVCPRRC